MTDRLNKVKKLISSHQDFPKPGILFRDIFPVLRDSEVFNLLIELLCEHVEKLTPKVEVIVGLESRGFLFGPIMAQRLKVAFVPVRKAGKLPGECCSVEYSLEYGKDKFEVQKEAIKPGQCVLIVDDLLATGGTMKAAVELMGKVSAEVAECLVVIELTDLKGRDKVDKLLHSLIQY
ncbi:adenine phosphoribosyltransferase-like [Babylonia areolata]|uniref:adenine phosphoribosyltransferase-like n=1 Tax=Babylonia areolata TaxID=304850 RepID=UPI003FD32D0F